MSGFCQISKYFLDQYTDKVKNYIQWISISLVFLGGFSQIPKFILDQKINKIQTHKFEESEQNNQVNINKLKEFQKQSEIESSIIKSFDSVLQVKYSFKGSQGSFSVQILSDISNECYLELKSNSTNKSIKFYATKPYEFSASNNNAVFKSTQTVRKDDYPIGANINELSSIDNIFIYLRILECNSIEDNKITIEQTEIIFFINDRKYTIPHSNQPFNAPITKDGYTTLYLKLMPSTFLELLGISSHP